jgi:mannose-6-phosphate isomerase-like protein (cupin superfamily)
MTGDLLHLTRHETLRVVSETPEELEVEGTWAPGGSAPPAHLHPSQDEQFEVQSGRLTAVVAGMTHELGPGDTLEIPRGTPHRMWNAGDVAAVARWRTRPAGRTAQWFRAIDALSAGGARKPPLPAMAKAVIAYSDVFQLAIKPRPLRPFVYLGLRTVAVVSR